MHTVSSAPMLIRGNEVHTTKVSTQLQNYLQNQPPNPQCAVCRWSSPQPPPPPPPPACPRTLTAGRHMVNEVPPLAEKGRTLNDEYVGIRDPHGNPADGPPLPNK